MATADEQLKEQLSGAAALAAQIDREKLGEKVRVYSLAKQLGISSKLLIEQLHTQGISKKAQSALTADEVGKLFDSLKPKLKQPEAEAPAAKEPVKKSRKATKSAAKKSTKATKKTAVKPAEEPAGAQPVDAAPAGGDAKADEPQEPVKKTRKRAVKKTSRTNAKMAAPKTEPESAEVPEPETQSVEAEVSKTETRKRSRTRRVVKRASSAPEATAASAEPAAQSPDVPDAAEQQEDEGDKLRYRVQKNVENEIQQIEGKVESELAAAALEALAEKQHDTDSDEPDINHDINIDGSFVQSLLTPPEQPQTGDDVLAAYAPIFMPPEPTSASKAKTAETESADTADMDDTVEESDDSKESSSTRRRRGHRGTSRGRGKDAAAPEQDEKTDVEIIDEPRGIKGSTRIESQRRRRAEMRSKDRESRHVVTQAEFLARREAVERTMVVRERERHDGHGMITQVAVLEDGMLVEHFVTDETNTSQIGNIYLGRVQNVLPSMEAAFIDIGTGRNGVLYAGEVNWRQAGLGGRSRKIEHAMKSGDQVLVQVAKDPVGHKGPRLTTQISLPGRFLVYVPGGRNAGISRKLPAPERKRLKEILERVVPDQGGAIIRTAAENVPEEAIAADVNRLHDRWNDIQESAKKEKSSKGSDPVALYEEPQMLVKVVRDLFNEDFDRLVVDGERPYDVVSSYVNRLAPELADRVSKYDRAAQGGVDAFEVHRIDEQLHKALSRKVWLPSGGTLVIDRTEAMTVVDVNTGKFTGTGGNLEETVTKNNLEAAEEIVRQMRLRDLGGMIVVDFIDMVLPENQELVLRRLKEALGRDRTRHQVSEVTSLGLVQMTRKRLGSGLLETFSTECEACQGRGLILHEDPVEEGPFETHDDRRDERGDKRRGRKSHRDQGHQDSHGNSHDQKDEKAQAHTGSTDEPGEDAAAKSNTERGSRRGQSRRVAAKRRSTRGNDSRQGKSSQDDSSLEDLLAGIVVDSSHVTEDATREGSVSDIESIAYAASDRAEALDEVGEFSSYITEEPRKDEQLVDATYEQAKKEFDESPRRKRKTRGNSRSDHAPRPEDFQSPATDKTQDAPKQPTVEKRRESKRSQVQAVTRGRRRAVRRVTQPRQAEQNNAASETIPSAGVETQRKRTDSGVEVTTVRRGRKRAVRRVAPRADARQGVKQGVKQDNVPVSTETPSKEQEQKSTGGRTRRRVARRGAK